MTPLRIFIGWDPREAIAFHVLSHSILTRATRPVAIIPLVQQQLRDGGIYTRERGPTETTEFSLTRFLVPYLSGYEGYSIFMDCDMLCLADIHELVENCMKAITYPERNAVWCVQHDYIPRTQTKMGGLLQTNYPRKNWSSLMVFDNSKCRTLTPEYVNRATGLELHRFHWARRLVACMPHSGKDQGLPDPGCERCQYVTSLSGEEQIGSIPLEWNWLVGEYEENPAAKLLHYTLGGPWMNKGTLHSFGLGNGRRRTQLG